MPELKACYGQECKKESLTSKKVVGGLLVQSRHFPDLNLDEVNIIANPTPTKEDIQKLTEEAKGKITAFEGNIAGSEEIPIAFGLKSVNITFTMDEEKGSTDQLEEDIANMEDVESAEVVDVRRAIG